MIVNNSRQMAGEKFMANPDHSSQDNRAVVIGAGLGGLAAAMRLGAKGYAVTVLDKLDRVGGRGSSITQEGHRFDLGPTIVTMPKVFESLWAACGRDFHADVDLRPLEPFYEIRWPDGSYFRASGDDEKMQSEVQRLNPADLSGYKRFLKDSQKRYVIGYEGMVAEPMHRLWETLKVLPTFAKLRADRSIYGLAARRVKDERLRMPSHFTPCSLVATRCMSPQFTLWWHIWKKPMVCIMQWAGCNRLQMPWPRWSAPRVDRFAKIQLQMRFLLKTGLRARLF